MRRLCSYLIPLFMCALFSVSTSYAEQKAQGWCQDGNYTVSVPGGSGPSTNKYQRSFPSCTVTVYFAGTVTLATIYSDDALTAKANPFTAASTGQWFFYAVNGRYDVKLSGGGIPAPFTIGDFYLNDNAANGMFTASDYKMKCDGATNDATAMQNAINAATALSLGGTVWIDAGFGTGTCVISSSISVPVDVHLRIDEGVRLSLATATTLTVLGPFTNPGQSQVFLINGTAAVKFGNSANAALVGDISPIWFGAKNNGSDAAGTTVAFQAALDSVTSFTSSVGDIGSLGSQCVVVPPGEYWISTTINMNGGAGSSRAACLRGASQGGLSPTLLWKGSANNSILSIGDTANTPFFYVGSLNFENPATSGSGVTAVRVLNISAIVLNPVAGTGVDNGMIEWCRFKDLTNGITSSSAAGINQLTIRHNLFTSIYNQISPVANPYTDALVTSRGNAINFDSGAIAGGGIYIEDNRFTAVQNQTLYAAGPIGVGNLVYTKNFSEPTSYTYSGCIELSMFNNIVITGNQIQSKSNECLNLGTTSMGSSNTSGGLITGNYVTTDVTSGGTIAVMQFTYANGVQINGNSFFPLSGGTGTTISQPVFKIYQTATNIQIGQNDFIVQASGGRFSNFVLVDGGPTNPGGLVVTSTAYSGGLGMMTGLLFDPEQQYELYDDFEGVTATTALTTGTTVTTTRVGWTALNTGAYTFIDGSGAPGTPNGNLRITGDGAAAGGVYCCQGTYPLRPNNVIILKVRWAQRGSGAGNRYIGISSGAQLSTDISNSTYFRHSVSGQITAVCRGAGVDDDTLNTGVSAADGVYHTGRMVIDRTGNVLPGSGIDVYIDGIYKGKFCGGNVPGSNAVLSAGTAATAAADGLDVDFLYASVRRQ